MAYLVVELKNGKQWKEVKRVDLDKLQGLEGARFNWRLSLLGIVLTILGRVRIEDPSVDPAWE